MRLCRMFARYSDHFEHAGAKLADDPVPARYADCFRPRENTTSLAAGGGSAASPTPPWKPIAALRSTRDCPQGKGGPTGGLLIFSISSGLKPRICWGMAIIR